MKNRGKMNCLILVLLLTLGFVTANAQEVYTSSGKSVNQAKKQQQQKKKGFDPSRIIVGGGIGLGFGDITAISATPVVGYKISDHFAAGIGLGYQYLRIKDYWEILDFNTNQYKYYPYKASIYSASVWGRYIIWKNLFAHVEYEHNFMSFKDYYQEYNYNTNMAEIKTRNVNYNAPSLLVGGGFRQPIGERFSIIFLALYDVIQDKYSPYRNRIDFRIGFNVGF